MKRNILLTPGPGTTTNTVKNSLVVPDICPREKEFCELAGKIAEDITSIVGTAKRYATVLFGGSGTAAVEAMISSTVRNGRLLVVNNGAYGSRIKQIADIYGIDNIEFKSSTTEPLALDCLEDLAQKKDVTHLAVVHHETTTGLLNDIKHIGMMCRHNNIDMLVDAVSSYAAIPINMEEMYIKHLAAVSNKNLQATPGVCFVISEIDSLRKLKHSNPANLYLNLFKQYEYFNKYRQFRFTPPVQVFYSLAQALKELKDETVEKRYLRYTKSWYVLNKGLSELGLKTVVDEKHSSKLMTTVIEPDAASYSFTKMHDFLYKQNYTIYPGKISDHNTFRLANIGDINDKDIAGFLKCLKKYLDTI